MRRWWPNRLPLRLRVFFRSAFALLALAIVALAIFELREEKALSYRGYRELFDRNTRQIGARLQHPSGQLALLNPTLPGASLVPLRPLLLPYSAIDFDDKAKAQQAAEMAGCLVQYPDDAQLCVAVGSNPVAGGYIYAVGSFVSGSLSAHTPGDPDLTQAHRMAVDVTLRGRRYRWLAPLESAASGVSAARSGRLTGFRFESDEQLSQRPDRDFRGWLWQDRRCMTAPPAPAAEDCRRRSFFSLRLPIGLFSEALRDPQNLVWPPQDLAQIQVRLQALGPGEQAPLFDSNEPGATPPFALSDLKAQLLAGETLRIRRAISGSDVISLTYQADAQPRSSRWLERWVARLPVPVSDQLLSARQMISTPNGVFEVLLTGDPHSADAAVGLLAERLSLFVAAILLAILLTWAAIERRIIHRITLLTGRAAALRQRVNSGELQLDLQGLHGSDELALLAGVLSDLLQRTNDAATRERLRIEQEKNLWHAIGHEIMSPLQSLSALHAQPDDPSVHYIERMRQAVRVLYGSASPSDAFLSASLQLQTLDVQRFLRTVAHNAVHAGIADVQFEGAVSPVMVRADEYSLEDVVTHVLTNADRYRLPGTPIRMTLSNFEGSARVRIHNCGSSIEPAMLGKIFEYGVSDHGAGAQRGQGLFVARTYMAKMGGTIEAANVGDGVEFRLTLAVA
jgi:signal transduction histidine kinase